MFESLRTNAASKVSLLTAISALAVPSFDRAQAQEAGSGDGGQTSQTNGAFSLDLSRAVVTLRAGAIGENSSLTDGQIVRSVRFNTDNQRPPGTVVAVDCTEPHLVVGVKAVQAGYDGNIDVTRPPFDRPVQFGFHSSLSELNVNVNREPDLGLERFPSVPMSQQWGTTKMVPTPGPTFLNDYSFTAEAGLVSGNATNLIILPAGRSFIHMRHEVSASEEGSVGIVSTTANVGQDYILMREGPFPLDEDLAVEVRAIPLASLAGSLVIQIGRQGNVQTQSSGGSPDRVKVSWTAAADLFQLEECDSLAGNWSPVHAPVRVSGNQFEVDCACGGESKFFRLRPRVGHQ